METRTRDEMYRRRKICCPSYARVVLAIVLLGSLIVFLVAAILSFTGHDEESFVGDEKLHQNGSNEDGLVEENYDEENDQLTSRRIVKRFIRNNIVEVENSNEVPKNAPSDSNNVSSDYILQSEEYILQSKDYIRNHHKHSDGKVYQYQGYKCLPIRKH